MRPGAGNKRLPRCPIFPTIRQPWRHRKGARNRWSSSLTSTRTWTTPLAKTIAEAVETTGPISLASYMRQCLTSPDGGYYNSPSESSSSSVHTGKDPFGRSGDFITSPEISQVFGELVGIWIVAEWMAQQRHQEQAGQGHDRIQKDVQLIELGPGRGTLMDDVLRTIKSFPTLSNHVTGVHLVESSPTLREIQKRKLCDPGNDNSVERPPMENTSNGFRCHTNKHLAGVPVTWSEDLRGVPKEDNTAPFILCHEFFDALPIHTFQSVPPNPNFTPTAFTSPNSTTMLETPTGPISLSRPRDPQQEATTGSKTQGNQWRELVVTPTPRPKYTSSLSPSSTLDPSAKSSPDFQLSLSRAPTRSSMFLPTLSARYKALLSTAGSTIEICPEAQSLMGDIARWIGGSNPAPSSPSAISQSPNTGASNNDTSTNTSSASGAALIIDYGPSTHIPISTLRGIRSHKQVSPFTSPGQVDLSADVDFGALVEAALDASPGVEVHGPVEQGAWLERMGVWERVRGIVQQDKQRGKPIKYTGKDKNEETEDINTRLTTAVNRLVERGGGGMGRLYKVLAVVPERGGKRPVGFGGTIDVK